MTRFLGAIALVLTSAAPALAGPIDGSVGVLYKPINPEIYGLEGELGPKGAAWSVGGLYQAKRWETRTGDPSGGHTWVNPTTVTAWGRWRFDLPNGDDASALLGVNYYPESAFIDVPTPESWRYVGPVIGASYTLHSGRLWFRATPHWAFSPDKEYQEGVWLSKSGIPWLEMGVHVLPQLQLVFRLSEAFLKVAYTFD